MNGDGARARVVHLAATPELLRQRLEARPGHYMKATMLDGQLATLEPPADLLQNPRTGSEPPAMRSDEASSSSRDAALTLDASLPVATLVGAIEAALGLSA